MPADTPYLSPPEVAALLGVAAIKVTRWILSGELRATDVSTGRKVKPRWRVKRTDLEEFLAGRSNRPAAAVTRRKPAATTDQNVYY